MSQVREDLSILGRREGRIHHLPIRVYYEDTDFTGIVYHANYLRFAERGRSDFLRSAGVSHARLLQENPPCAFVITEMNLRFLAAAHIDDLLDVRTETIALRRASFQMRQQIVLLDTILFEATIRAACINPESPKMAPLRIPENLTGALKPLLPPSH